MGKEIRLTSTLLITTDYKGTRVTSLLPYDNNMLYLPLPDASVMTESDSLDKDIIYIAPLEDKETRTGRVNR
jgi:CRISPR/Cas system CSM-associated protein Csm4 (group 5 of RAMP superfamily)